MQLILKVVGGAHAGQEIPVPGPKFLIGRSQDCQLRPSSDLISRHHCVLMIDGDLAAIRDFGSRNGTYVNDERVEGERTLQAGDRLKVGALEFTVNLIATPGSKKRPKVRDVNDAISRTAGDRERLSEADLDAWMSEDDDRSFQESEEAPSGQADPTSSTTIVDAKGKSGIKSGESSDAAAEALRRLQKRKAGK